MLDGGCNSLGRAAQEPLVGRGHEATGHHLGRADQPAVLLVHGDHDQEHAIPGQGTTVAQHDVADLADGHTIHIHVAGVHGLPAPGAAVGQELDGLAVLDDEDVPGLKAHVRRQATVLHEHAELAMDGDDVAGLGQVEHQLQLFLAGVAGDVGALDGVVVDVGAGLEEVVHGPRHVFLVAGDGAGADDDGVSGCRLPTKR